jgi:hypothetical protein
VSSPTSEQVCDFVRDFYCEDPLSFAEIAHYFPEDGIVSLSAISSSVGTPVQQLNKLVHALVSNGFATRFEQKRLVFLNMHFPFSAIQTWAWKEYSENKSKYRKPYSVRKNKSFTLDVPGGELSVKGPRAYIEEFGNTIANFITSLTAPAHQKPLEA